MQPCKDAPTVSSSICPWPKTYLNLNSNGEEVLYPLDVLRRTIFAGTDIPRMQQSEGSWLVHKKCTTNASCIQAVCECESREHPHNCSRGKPKYWWNSCHRNSKYHHWSVCHWDRYNKQTPIWHAQIPALAPIFLYQQNANNILTFTNHHVRVN